MSSYFKRMSKDDLRELYDDRVADVLKAQGYTWTPSPRSVYRVEKLFEALAKFAPANAPRTTNSLELRRGYDFARACFSKDGSSDYLHPLPLQLSSVQILTKNRNGSAGITAFGQKKAMVMEYAFEKSKLVLSRERAPEPCVAFKRTQFNDKTRLVWGYPYTMTILEGLIAQPLLEKFKQGHTPMAFSMPTGVLGSKLRVASYNRKYAYSVDMSSFDSSVSSHLIKMAFKIIATWFHQDEIVYDGWTVKDVLDRVEHYFLFTPIVMPDGNLYRGKVHGVPSGSYFTQIVDSIVNCIVAGTLSAKFHLKLNKRWTFVLGDDLLFFSDVKVSLDELATYCLDELKIKMHGSEKSRISSSGQDIHFLGRDWHNGVPDISVEGILQRMVYPESFRMYSDDPVKAKRQVKLLLLSYAAVYRSGWSIVQHVLGDWEQWYQSMEMIECDVYGQGTMVEVLEDRHHHLSGYHRFMLKYFGPEEGCAFTTSAIQFWL